MSKIWFVAHGQRIRGPFSTEEVDGFLQTGSLTTSSLIWWKGEPAWHSISTWKANLPHILRTLQPQEEKEWFIQHGMDHWGPITKTEILKTLESAYDPTIFRLWCVGMEKWQSIYHFADVCKHLGIKMRKNVRVPMLGSANIETAYDNIIANTSTISSGGFGLQKTPLPSGSMVRVTIKSPVLPIPIHANAEVCFSAPDGYTGLKFDSLTAEASSAIMDYVKKFSKAS